MQRRLREPEKERERCFLVRRSREIGRTDPTSSRPMDHRRHHQRCSGSKKKLCGMINKKKNKKTVGTTSDWVGRDVVKRVKRNTLQDTTCCFRLLPSTILLKNSYDRIQFEQERRFFIYSSQDPRPQCFSCRTSRVGVASLRDRQPDRLSRLNGLSGQSQYVDGLTVGVLGAHRPYTEKQEISKQCTQHWFVSRLTDLDIVCFLQAG